MKIDRPLWGQGVLLTPQLFQQQVRLDAWANDQLARLAHANPWGVLAVEFDEATLKLGVLKASRLSARLADGTLLCSDRGDPLPPALELARLAQGAAEIVLALPWEHANGSNCVAQDEVEAKPTRYRQGYKQVQDHFGDEAVPVPVMAPQLTLRAAVDDNADFLTCPVARVIHDVHGGWVLDATFIPPLLSLAAHPGLCRQLGDLLSQLNAKRQRLMGLRRESHERMADFAVADVSLFWLLNALNTHQPLLADLVAQPRRHPEVAYRDLARLAGALLTFSLDHGTDAIPAYDHAQPLKVFPPLLQLLGSLLEASLPSRVIALALEKDGAHQWLARLHDTRLREPGGADFYLSVRSALPAAQVHSQFPRLCKVGVPDEVAQWVNAALEGIPLRPAVQIPSALPLRMENQYFTLDLSHPKGGAMLTEGLCAFYVPSVLASAELELFAVLRS